MNLNVKRLIFAAVAVVAVLVIGLYVRQDGTDNQAEQQPSPEQQAQRQEETISPAKQVSSGNELQLQTTSPVTFEGQVSFPSGVSPVPIDLEVQFLKTGPSLPDEILSRLKDTDLEEVSRLYFQRVSEANPDQFNREFIKNSRRSRTVRSDTSGSFTLQNVPSGIYQVEVKADNWKGRSRNLSFQSPGQTDQIIVPVTPEVTLTGQVVDQSGNPLPGVTIYSEAHNTRTRTDGQGNFRLSNLPGGEKVGPVRVTQDGFKSKTITVGAIPPRQSQNVSITLQSQGKGSITVRVNDTENQPVSDGLIYLIPLYEDDPPLKGLRSQSLHRMRMQELRQSPWVKSLSGSGSVTFSDLRPGPYQATLLVSDHVASPQTTELQPNKNSTIELQAARGEEVTVRFLNKKTEEPLLDVRPLFKAYAESGRRLAPGLQIQEIPQPGTIRGILPPRTHRLLIELTVQGNKRARPSEFEFTKEDFPNLTVEARLLEDEEQQNPYQSVQLNLQTSRPDLQGILEELRSAGIDFWNKDPQIVSYRESGRRELFDQIHEVRHGNYRVFGSLKTLENRYTVFKTITLPQSKQTKSVTLEPQRAGTLSVEASPNTLASVDVIRMGLVPFEITNPDAKPPGPREYPRTLVKILSPERKTTKFSFVPPNLELRLVIRKDYPAEKGEGETQFQLRTIPPFSPGEKRSITIQ